mgnify:CR=1 FL=1
MTLKTTHQLYRKTSNVPGETEEVVSAQFVNRYIGAKGFFEGLDGGEDHRQYEDGTIVVASTSPDKSKTHVRTFTPIPDGELE